VEALRICAFVLVLITAASELDAVPTTEFVFPFTTAATELDAVWTSESVAREPTLRPAPVRVRVPFVHTSAASVPNVVRLRVPFAHTAAGRFKICAESDVEAVNICAFVFPFTTAAIELEAVPTVLFVLALMAVWLALMAELRELVAVCTSDNVASDPALKPAPVSVRVPAAQMSVAIEVPEVSVRVAAAHTATGMLSI
jgi:hypothetical protein